MTAANDPSLSALSQGSQASTDITSAPPAPPAPSAFQAGLPEPGGEDSIPLPPLTLPPRRQTTPEQLAKEITRLDWGLAILVLVLAFMLASFAVRNSDFWQHLASGRLYANGQFNFGVDPFTYTAGDSYWVNLSWLYDGVMYGLASLLGGADSAFGGAALVVLKALLVTALAWVMLRTARPSQSLWAPAVFTALALLVMSPRLLFQPILVSMLFLSLTLYLLQRVRHEEHDTRKLSEPRKSPLTAYWLLVPLFALWANLDNWFLLGPVTVALFLLGQLLQQVFAPVRTGADAPEPKQLQTLGLVLIAASAGCLLNPHHYHVFVLPFQLSPATPVDVYMSDSVFSQYFYGPFSSEFLESNLAWNAASTSYALLLGVSLFSFLLSYFHGWRWWRFLIWLAFGLLSLYHWRDVPFFAVVAGPITALNFQDYAAGRFGLAPLVQSQWRAWSLGGRIASILACILLLLAAWPGWLHVKSIDARSRNRVSWTVNVDPSLRRTAEQLNDWRQQGLLQPENLGFNYGPDVLNYCAWFCADEKGRPREKGFFDYRLQIFPKDVATQYIDVRQALRSVSASGADAASQLSNWQAVFRKHRISHVLLNRGDRDFQIIWTQMLLDWDQWPLIYQDGQTCIFSWQDPRRRSAPTAPHPQRFDPNPLAFGPNAVRAPVEGPATPPELQDIYKRYLVGTTGASLQAEAAERYMEYYNLIKARWPAPYLLASEFGLWMGTVTSCAASPASGSVAAPATWILHSVPMRAMLLAMGSGNRPPFLIMHLLRDQDQGPVAAPLLAIRAARQAIKTNPDDAAAYFILAKAYTQLTSSEEEHWAGHPYASQNAVPRLKLRQIQIVTAWERYLRLRPDDWEAHYSLVQAYLQAKYLDLALDHLREVAKYFIPDVFVSKEAYAQQKDRIQQDLKQLEKEVARQRSEYDAGAADQTQKVHRAALALNKQLGKLALEELLPEADEVKPEEIDLLLFLLLSTGRPEDARLLLGPSSGATLQNALKLSYNFYWLLMEASEGNYQSAGEYINKATDLIEKSLIGNMLNKTHESAFRGIDVAMLQGTDSVFESVRLAANYRVMRGMLAVEEGDTATALRYFQEALALNDGQPWDFESRGIAVNYLKHLKAAQK